MKAFIDQEICIGCNLCVEICHEVFILNSSGKAVAKVDIVPKEIEGKCRGAAESCPVSAIHCE